MPAVWLTNSYFGMGDNIWALAHIKELCRQYDTVYLDSPWLPLYWGFPKVKVLHPDHYRGRVTWGSDNVDVSGWPLFREIIGAQPRDAWAWPSKEELERADKISWGYQTMEVSRIARLHPMKLPDRIDLGLPLKLEWIQAAQEWLNANVPVWPRCLLHIPVVCCGGTHNPRFPFFRHYQKLYADYKDRVSFFDAARVEPGAACLQGELPGMPIFYSRSDQAPILWAMMAMTDMAVVPDNHGVPLGLSQKTNMLYLGGNVDRAHLFDPRLDLSWTVTVMPESYGDLDSAKVDEGFRSVLSTISSGQLA
jgi:hypothetical protein